MMWIFLLKISTSSTVSSLPFPRIITTVYFYIYKIVSYDLHLYFKQKEDALLKE